MNSSPSDLSAAFRALLDAARAAEKILQSHPDATADAMADAYFYLAGQLAFQLERHFKGGDRDRPCFVRMMDSHRSSASGTLNHHYYVADIDGRAEYRILCDRGNLADVCFEVVSGIFGDNREPGERIASLSSHELLVEPNGRFEVYVGGEQRSGNWLPSNARARSIFVRQTVNNWVTEQPTPMLIERIDQAPAPFRRPEATEVGRRYVAAAEGLLEQVGYLQEYSQNWRKTLPVNEFLMPKVGPTDAGYHPSQFNTLCQWQIGRDEALLVSFEPPAAAFQAVDLSHSLWFNAIYPRSVSSSLTKAHSTVSSDGIYRFVVSARDPGVNNWLDTAGLEHGFLTIRWQGLSGRTPAKPSTEIVKLSELRSRFPDNEPGISAEQRARMLWMREKAMDRRFF